MRDAARAYAVLDAIKQNEHALDMDRWVGRNGLAVLEPVTLDDLFNGGCGTTACFAGWTVLLAGYFIKENDQATQLGNTLHYVPDLAGKLLGIGLADRDLLFFCDKDSLPGLVEQVFGPDPR